MKVAARSKWHVLAVRRVLTATKVLVWFWGKRGVGGGGGGEGAGAGGECVFI